MKKLLKKLRTGSFLVAATLTAVLALSGCGSDDGDSEREERKPFASSESGAVDEEDPNKPLEPNRAITGVVT